MLKNKTALITGCNRGLGKGLLKTFSEYGATIFAHSRNQEKEFTDYIFKLSEDYNVEIIPIYFDLTNSMEILEGMKQIKNTNKRVDILVNSAGVTHSGLFQLTSLRKIKEVFDVNYFANIELSQYISRIMIKQKSGNIINIASYLGEDAEIGNCAYGTSKSALIMLTKVMSLELASMGIRVNAIAPGPLDTGMTKSINEKTSISQIQRTALKRLGTINEISEVIAFLASDKASYITGQVIRVDGGIL